MVVDDGADPLLDAVEQDEDGRPRRAQHERSSQQLAGLAEVSQPRDGVRLREEGEEIVRVELLGFSVMFDGVAGLALAQLAIAEPDQRGIASRTRLDDFSIASLALGKIPRAKCALGRLERAPDGFGKLELLDGALPRCGDGDDR